MTSTCTFYSSIFWHVYFYFYSSSFLALLLVLLLKYPKQVLVSPLCLCVFSNALFHEVVARCLNMTYSSEEIQENLGRGF